MSDGVALATLMQVAPFNAYSMTWIWIGDGGGAVAQRRFGDWAIDRLLERLAPNPL